MKTPPQPETTPAGAADDWSPETVMAMDLCLLTHPDMDVQHWFEEQVVLHLGCLPHGKDVSPSPIA